VVENINAALKRPEEIRMAQGKKVLPRRAFLRGAAALAVGGAAELGPILVIQNFRTIRRFGDVVRMPRRKILNPVTSSSAYCWLAGAHRVKTPNLKLNERLVR